MRNIYKTLRKISYLWLKRKLTSHQINFKLKYLTSHKNAIATQDIIFLQSSKGIAIQY